MKKQFLILFAFISVLTFGQSTQRFYKVLATGDMTSPKFIKTGSTADSVLLGNGSAKSVASFKTDTISLSNRINAKQNTLSTNQATVLSNLTGINSNTIPKSTAGGYANSLITDNGTAVTISGTISAGNLSNSNSGDNATNSLYSGLVSNATHTGDATGSTALTLATVNSNIGTFNNITINAKGLATGGSNVSYEPSFSKNTGFNKNFGTTTGTVLEGRTFGTAANSTVGDFIQNQNSSAQSANMWISGDVKNNGYIRTISGLALLGASGGYTTGDVASMYFGVPNSDFGYIKSIFGDKYEFGSYHGYRFKTSRGTGAGIDALNINVNGDAVFASSVNATQLQSAVATGIAPLTVNSTTMVSNLNAEMVNGLKYYGADFASTVSYLMAYDAPNARMSPATSTQIRSFIGVNNIATQDLSSITNNYIPKWNGSSMVNSLISETGTSTVIIGKSSNAYSVVNLLNSTANTAGTTLAGTDVINDNFNGSYYFRTTSGFSNRLVINNDGVISIPSTTASTSPTTGALIVAGGIGADHVRANNFYGNGSGLTGISDSIIYQTQTTVNGSTSGNMVCSMPFRTGTYKKIMIVLNSIIGTARFNYPTYFSTACRVTVESTTGGGTRSAYIGFQYYELTCDASFNGIITLEGY